MRQRGVSIRHLLTPTPFDIRTSDRDVLRERQGEEASDQSVGVEITGYLEDAPCDRDHRDAIRAIPTICVHLIWFHFQRVPQTFGLSSVTLIISVLTSSPHTFCASHNPRGSLITSCIYRDRRAVDGSYVT